MHPPVNVPERMLPTNPPLVFSLAAFDRDAYDELPEWLRGVIAKSPEHQAIVRATDPESDAPLAVRLKRQLQLAPSGPEPLSAGKDWASDNDDDLDDGIPF